MFEFAKFAARLQISVPRNFAMSMIIGCFALWVAARCIVDARQSNEFSLLLGAAFLAFLLWRGWLVARADNAIHKDLTLVLPTLMWATWLAHRGTDFFIWCPPLVLLVAFFTSSSLIFSSLSIMLVLTTGSLLYLHGDTHAMAVAGSMILMAVCAALYRSARDDMELGALRHVHHLQLVLDAARMWHAEIDAHGELIDNNEWLFQAIGIALPVSDAPTLSELIHPGDLALVMRARRQALDLGTGVIAATAACNCRLLRSDASTLWVHAQFVRTDRRSPSVVVTFIDIDTRLRAEEALRDSQRKLASQALELSAQFDAAKTALHARQEVERLAQHDLRSPLKSIEAAAALLRRGRILSTNEEQLLTSIECTAARALSMVTMSLDLYRMEEGTFKFIPETIDLVAIGRSVIAELSHHARSKHVRLEFDTESNGLQAIGNSLLTTSVVENLVRNALEAAPEHSAVTMGLYQGVRVGLLIHNEGEVNPLVRKDFFEKYVTHGKSGGLGLGTYSARLIARAQGGDLTMSSSAENGTMLALKLKRASSAPADPTMHAAMPQGTFEISLPGALIERPVSHEAEEPQSPIEILVVEDDDHNWLLLLSWLPKHVGARRAINGREAVDALTMRRPDLVVMDLEMPVMNGFEALGRIREMQSSAAEEPSVVYAFTGYDDAKTIRRIREAGFDGVLSKPVQRKEFDDLMREISRRTAIDSHGGVWVEKKFVEAFPAFVESRRALVDNIEQAARSDDMTAMRRAAHTLAGSPAIHGFDAGIAICRQIISMAESKDLGKLDDFIAELRRMLARPAAR